MTRQTVPEQPKEIKGIWKPTVADSKREGEYLRIESPKAGKEKFGETYVILEPSGKELFLPNHIVLQTKMKTLKTGEYVWISYIGKDNKTLLYNVEHDSEYKRQTKLDEPTDASTQLLKVLVCSTSGISDAEFWKHVEHLTGGNQSGGMALVEHLKAKGEIFRDADGFWKAGK